MWTVMPSPIGDLRIVERDGSIVAIEFSPFNPPADGRPLGGPVDFAWFGHYSRNYHLGGFCTYEERQTLGDAACGMASNDRTPPLDDIYLVDQNFEYFYYPDGREGQVELGQLATEVGRQLAHRLRQHRLVVRAGTERAAVQGLLERGELDRDDRAVPLDDAQVTDG